MRRAALLLALLLAAPVPALAQTSPRDSLHAFLQTTFAEARGDNADTSYVAAFADLNGDGRDEALVSLSSVLFCGSGGCALYIYTPDGESWRQVAELTIVNAPVRLLATRSRGWRDLAVHVRGGGFEIPHEARMRFDGTTYGATPSTSGPLRRGTPGRILINTDTASRRLF